MLVHSIDVEFNSHAAVEVHAVDTNVGVVLDTKIDVLADTEAEVTGLGEVALPQLVFLDLEATLEDLLSLGATDGDVDGDLFVTADTEGTDGVAGLACCTFPSRQPFHPFSTLQTKISHPSFRFCPGIIENRVSLL